MLLLEKSLTVYYIVCFRHLTELDPEILISEGRSNVGYHAWPTKKILDFRWSEKAKITLETISFWRIISTSILKFCPFFLIIKAWLYNHISFLDFANAFRSYIQDFEEARLIIRRLLANDALTYWKILGNDWQSLGYYGKTSCLASKRKVVLYIVTSNRGSSRPEVF